VTGVLVEPLAGCLAVDTGAGGRWGLAVRPGSDALAGVAVGDRVAVTGRPTRPEAAHPAWPGPTVTVLAVRPAGRDDDVEPPP
jgi:hypothetical protein